MTGRRGARGAMIAGFALAAWLPSAGFAAPTLTIRGSVVDSTGAPYARAQVFVEGSARAETWVDARGRFALEIPVRAPDSLLRAPYALWVRARRLDGRITMTSGEPELRLEARGDFDSSSVPVVRVRSNDPTSTRRLAAAITAGRGLADTLVVNFRTASGKPAAQDLAMPAAATVRFAGGFAADAGPPMEEPEGPPAVIPSPGAASDSCACRIEGTIEVRSNQPLRRRVQVDVWLEGDERAAERVELFMGSPRAFVLTARGCREHLVRYAVRSGPRFDRLAPNDLSIRCDRSGLRQLRIVLAPPGRGD